ncbi:MAG: T9SS type A sorting domain-containing protein [Calditrichaeota bacterium]|nr:T9SS type A sorting domain-containing protein [Calditrichota bacterium]
MWVAYMGINGNRSTFVALDLDNNYEVVDQFPGPIQMIDICFYNGIFYITDRGNQVIHRYDRGGNNIGDVRFDGWFGGGIAASAELGLAFIQEDWPNQFERPIHVYTINEDGEFAEHVGDIENYNGLMLRHNENNNRGRNLEWVDDHDGGSLWIGTGGQDGNLAWQFTVDRESWEAELAQSFYTWEGGFGTELDDVSHDGTNLWAVGWSNGAEWRSDIRIIDDGLNEQGWLYWEAQSGEIDPGDDQVIFVNIDTRGLISGDYSAELYFFSNDPIVLDGPDHIIEINLTVTGVPNIVVIPGGDEQEPVDFEIAYFGYPISRTVTVQNIGTDELQIDQVLRDNDNPDFYVLEEDLADFGVDESSEMELTIWYDPNPERGGEQEGTLVFMTNDPNREGGYSVRCIVSTGAFGAPLLVIEPQEVAIEMDQGDIIEEIVNVTNEGESDLHFTSAFVIVSQPGLDDQSRSMRSVSENRGLTNGEFPQRDHPEGRGLLIQESCRFYEHDFEQYFASIEGLDYERYHVWEELDELNLNDFDFMWIGNAETDMWTADHNDFMERLEEFVDGGGVLYHSSGQQQFNVIPTNPGGLVAVVSAQVRQTRCPIQLNPEENYFIDYMNENDPSGWNWRAGQQLIGFRDIAPFTYGYFRSEDLEEIDNSDWYEVMVRGNEIDEPVVVTYRYGSGYCFVNTALDGYHHHWPQTAQWGRTGEAVIWYMDFLSAELDTLSLAPSFGTLNPGEDADLVLTVNSGGLIGGEYEIELHILSNDPENPDQIVDIHLNTTGIPELIGNPIPEPLEGADIIELDNPRWVGQSYSIDVMLENTGTQAVMIEEIEVTDPENWGFIFPNDEMTIHPLQEVVASIVYHPIELGEHQVAIRMQTDARNVEDGFFWWEASATAILPPEIDVALPDGENSINVGMVVNDDPLERVITISNAEGDPRSDLMFNITSETVERAPLVDQLKRQIREINSEAHGPMRDEAGDILEQFVVPSTQTTGLVSVGNLIWGCSYEQSRIFAFNRETQDIDLEVAIHRTPMALAYDGNSLWTTQWGAAGLFRYDLEGELLENIEFDIINVTSITSDMAGTLFIKANENNRIYAYSVEDREVIRVINQLPGFEFNAGTPNIEFVPDHENGQLWGAGLNQLYQARITDDWQTEHVQTIDIEQGWSYRGLCHDGENFWIGSIDNVWSVIDDGIIEGLPGWLTIEPLIGEIAEGESSDITLTIDPSGLENNNIYQADISIESNDPENSVVEIPVSLMLGIPQPRHFRQDDPETEEIDGWVVHDALHTIDITEVTLDLEPIPSGWEIGVFTPEGVIAGGAIWVDGENLELQAFGNDPEDERVTGFVAGDRFGFQIWDEDTNIEYIAEALFADGPEMWISNRISVVSLSYRSDSDLLLSFHEGWNMISINVDPLEFYLNENDSGPDVPTMFEELQGDNNEHSIQLLKDEIGRFWTPGWNFNNIPFWELTQGYQVKLVTEAEITFTGISIDPGADVPLEQGWNIIAYLPDFDLDASAPDYYVLSPIIDNVVLAKDFIGHFMVPEHRFSNMDPWRAGQGYQVNIDSDEPIVLNYPEEQVELADSKAENQDIEHWGLAVNTGENMSVLLNHIDGLTQEVSYQVAAFSISGLLVGTGTVEDNRCGISVWGDDVSTENRDGLVRGELINFKIWDDKNNIESELFRVQNFEDDKLVYEPNGFRAVNVSLDNLIPEDFYLSECFPNPFNNTTRLTFGLPEGSRVSVTVFDINGRLVDNLVNTQFSAGSHDLTWNAEDVSAGIYMVRINAVSMAESLNFRDVKKVILVK